MPLQPPFRLFIKPGCPWCVQARAWLDAEGYSYDAIDVLADANAFAEMRELSGQSLTPTLLVLPSEEEGEEPTAQKLLADFDVDELRVFLAEHRITPTRA